MTDLSTRQSQSVAGSTLFVVDAGRFLRNLFLACLVIETGLVCLDLTVNWWQWSDSGSIRRLFNTTREDGLASWFAVSQTLLVALTLWVIAAALHRQGAPGVRRIGWVVIALFFSYMCIDDGAAVHERLGSAFEASAGVGAFPSYAWQYLLLPFFALMGAFTLYFLWNEMPRRSDHLKVAAALGCFVLAVGMDFVEGMDDGYRGLAAATGWQSGTIRHFSKSLEEFIEMAGMSIFLVTFLGFLAATAPHLSVRFVNRPDAE